MMQFDSPEQRQKVWLLGGLYISQFLGLGFIFTAMPAILRQAGVGLEQIAGLYFIGLIWSFKFLWAPLIDRYGSKRLGHYRGWILVLQTLLVLTMVVTAFFRIPEQLSTLMVVFAIISTLSATQDIATDALAVTVLRPNERGVGNSIQTSGGMIGNLIGGGVVLVTYQWLGWTGSMLVLAAGTALPLITVWRHREKPAPADARAEKVSLLDILRFFRRPGILRWLPLLMLFNVATSMAYGLINPILVDLGWSLDRIGFSVNIFGVLLGIVGAVLAGWFVQRIGRKMTMLLSEILVIFSIMALFFPAQGVDNLILTYVAIGLITIGNGASITILYTMMMDKSDPASAGTDYTIQYSVGALLSFVIGGLTLALAGSFGYTGALTAAIVIALIAIALVLTYQDYDPIEFETATPAPFDDVTLATTT